MSEITLDFETSSLADLGKVGSTVYAKHITTEILSLTYQVNDGELITWVPNENMVDWWWFDALLRELANDPQHIWICHNAGFEKDIWREIMVPRFGFPDIPNERWHDILASCALRTLPLKLDDALHSTGLPGKDMAASKFTNKLSKPDKKGMLDRSPESLAKVYAYNRSDVEIERALHKKIGYLPEQERRIWLIDQEINERGVKFDIPMVHGALKIREAATVPLIEEFRNLTGGINPTQVARFKDWMAFNGVKIANMRKETVNKLLGLDEDEDDADRESFGSFGYTGDDVLPGNVKRALTIRALVGSSSVKKYDRMAECADPVSGRVFRLLQYHGAGTGRWAGRLFNAHNFPRGFARVAGEDNKGRSPDPELLAQAVTFGSVAEVMALGCFIEYGENRVPADPIEVLASALRNTIIADHGKYLLIGDWSAIEARIVLAISGQHDKTALMANGVDVYLSMAEQIYGEKGLTKADLEKRQVGKNTILGCGFQMGWEKFHARYCPNQSEEFAQRAINAYRKEWAPCVPKLWDALGRAALKAVQSKQSVDSGYGISYRIDGSWLVGTCFDGSQLYYFRPTLCRRAMPWDVNDVRLAWQYQVNSGIGHSRSVDEAAKNRSSGWGWASGHGRGGASGQWVSAYGGLLTENYIQHMARQLLARALGLCRREGLPVILHNQDEIIMEHSNPDIAALKQIMEDRPRWAEVIKLPLAAECHQPCRRYHK